MNREDIEKAANIFTEDYVENGNLRGFRGSHRMGFIVGANWRINSVWHDVSEYPTIGEDIVILRNDKKITDLHVRSEIQWKEAVKIYNITKWAYQKDLLPNT